MNWIGPVGLCLLMSPMVLAIVWMMTTLWKKSKLEGVVFSTMMLGVVLFMFGYFILPELQEGRRNESVINEEVGQTPYRNLPELRKAWAEEE